MTSFAMDYVQFLAMFFITIQKYANMGAIMIRILAIHLIMFQLISFPLWSLVC